jgi:protein transport protein SEC20
VEEVGEEYRGLAGVIGQSKRLITKYARREFTDKVLIIFALAFFFAVVLYILRKRVFPSYGPIELIMYLFGGFTSVFTTLASLWS